MTHSCSCQCGAPGVLDVRELAPRTRHPRIFEAFDALPPGGAFVLVNDHDPKPLFYQLQFERPGACRWRYLEEGPEVWRVEIGKTSDPITADRTVGDVIHGHAGARAVLEAAGIDHCCSAQLTLAEAAATVGVPVENLLRGLNEAAKVGVAPA